MKRERRALLATAATLIALLGQPAATAFADPISDLSDLPCQSYETDDGQRQEICSGEVPSWDSTALDVDLTKPIGGGPGRHPLIVMLHGFGGNKHNWESTTDEGDGRDKWHWNSHWFAKHGYYVLSYTARGHCEDPGQCQAKGDEPDTLTGSSADGPRATVHLKSREIEIRDTQWLAALAAKTPDYDIDPQNVAVTGGSYGGGESWMQAAYPDWTFPSQETHGYLPALRLQVAIPKYPWTDLAYSLAPNGHGGGPSGKDIYESALGTPTVGDESAGTPRPNPLGTEKLSFVEGLLGNGAAGHVVFEEGNAPGEQECAYSTVQWHNRATVFGDPYDAALPPPRPGCEPAGAPPPASPVPGDEVSRQLRRGLTTFRGSYYQDAAWKRQRDEGRETAVFSIQGWTDDLFPAVESFRQFKYLKRLDPLWPVSVAVADVGHQRGQNKPETWRRLNDQAFQFLQANIEGSHRQQTTVLSEPTRCPPDEAAPTKAQQLTATTPEALSRGELRVDYSPGDTSSPGGALSPDSAATDPVLAGNQCTEVPAPKPPSDLATYDRTSQPLQSDLIYVGLGHVAVDYSWTGADTATLNAKLWDQSPDGKELLVTRGTYRLFDQPGYDSHEGTLKLPFFGNHWQLKPGHRLHLQLTQVDQPFLRPSTLPSTMHLNSVQLHLPTRQAADRVLAGG